MAIVKFSEGGGEEVLTLAPPINKKAGLDILRKINALLRFHFKVQPELLTDTEYSALWQELKFALDFESRRNSATDNNQKIEL